MYLCRMTADAIDPNKNPNKYYQPNGTFNTCSAASDIAIPNCTQYCWDRGQEMVEANTPMPFVRPGGGFGNAKTWIDTTAYPTGSIPKAGAIGVFDGTYGHVVAVEDVIDSTHCIITQSMYDADKSLRNYKFWSRVDNQELVVGKATIGGVGAFRGFIYLPVKDKRVKRNEAKNQIKVTDRFINIRKQPTTSAENYRGCFCPVGIYNVLDTATADGYTWYKLDEEHWIAGVDEVQYLPKTKDDPTEPAQEDPSKNQIYLGNAPLRVRVEPSTNAEQVGLLEPNHYYNVASRLGKQDYTWYELGDNAWVAGIEEVTYHPAETSVVVTPVDRDINKNQVFVGTSDLRIRQGASLSDTIVGHCRKDAYYNVFSQTDNDGYHWYEIGDDAWIAEVSGVEYMPIGFVKIYGIDISEWNDTLDLARAKSEGVGFAMIRAGFTGSGDGVSKQKDRCFEQFYAQCKSLSIKAGAYWYSCATSYDKGVAEATWMIEECLKGKQFEYPIAIDVEDEVHQKAAGKQAITEAIKGFCTTLINRGYYPIVYANTNWFNNYIDVIQLTNIDKWVANWGDIRPDLYGGYMWQYSSSDTVAGLRVDTDYSYKDYEPYMRENELNGFGGEIMSNIPTPVAKDDKKNQIYINYPKINARVQPTTNSESLGFFEIGYYNVYDVTENQGYTWYKLGDAWAADEISYYPVQSDPQPTPTPDPEPEPEPDEWEEPQAVQRDSTKNQIHVGDFYLNMREEPRTDAKKMGAVEKNSYYDVFETATDDSYTWYKLGDRAWGAGVEGVTYYPIYVKPEPVDVDEAKDQVWVGNVVLSIRQEPSTKSTRMGYAEENANYNVLDIAKKSDYTWYKLAEDAWIADCDDEVIYYPAGSSRLGPILKKEIPECQSALSIALNCVEHNACSEHYEDLKAKIEDLTQFINDNFDNFDYDYVDPKEYDEIDLLYTADVHGAWVGYDEDGNYLTPVFNYDDIAGYQEKLRKNKIKALLVDCGDWSRPCRVYDDYVNTGRMISAEEMNAKEYFACTYGNHEWKWGSEDETVHILNMQNSMTACNFFKNGKLVYKPYRTAKIGSKKVAAIGIGYPSPNGQGDYNDGVWTLGEYTFLDDNKLFAEVQKHIDYLKSNGFDYIVIVTHMCKSSYESDGRYYARTDSLIENTHGLTAVLQGHYNFATNAETIQDNRGNTVLLAHESGANMNSFGRLQMKGNKISSYLLDEQSDLKVI